MFDYSKFSLLFNYIRKLRPTFVINAAGYAGNPNIDTCEHAREATLNANMLLPQQIAHVCCLTKTPWGHVSSGGIFCGAKLVVDGKAHVERDLSLAHVRHFLDLHPEAVRGFSEQDEPNFSFLSPPCSFYSGTKALGEQAISDTGDCYVWRPGLPFNEADHPRNFLSKLQQYAKVFDQIISATHTQDFAAACLDLWELRAEFGTYHVANPGFVTTRQVAEMIQTLFHLNRPLEFWKDSNEFYRYGAKELRPNCLLDVSKILRTGVKIRPVESALEAALRAWRPAQPAFEFFGTGSELKVLVH
jgi:UDP-glucose 4,6-dehydratase